MAGNSSIDTPRGFATDAFGQEQPGTGYGPGPSDAETIKLKRLEGFGDGEVDKTGEEEPSELDQLVIHLDKLREQRTAIDQEIARAEAEHRSLLKAQKPNEPLKEDEIIIRGTQ